MGMSMFMRSHNAEIKCLLLHWKHIQDLLNVSSRQHKVLQMGTEIVLSSLLPEIKRRPVYRIVSLWNTIAIKKSIALKKQCF